MQAHVFLAPSTIHGYQVSGKTSGLSPHAGVSKQYTPLFFKSLEGDLNRYSPAYLFQWCLRLAQLACDVSGFHTNMETLSLVAFHFLGASTPISSRDPRCEAVVLFPVGANVQTDRPRLIFNLGPQELGTDCISFPEALDGAVRSDGAGMGDSARVRPAAHSSWSLALMGRR